MKDWWNFRDYPIGEGNKVTKYTSMTMFFYKKNGVVAQVVIIHKHI
jgi:hypothetical protein